MNPDVSVSNNLESLSMTAGRTTQEPCDFLPWDDVSVAELRKRLGLVEPESSNDFWNELTFWDLPTTNAAAWRKLFGFKQPEYQPPTIQFFIAEPHLLVDEQECEEPHFVEVKK